MIKTAYIDMSATGRQISRLMEKAGITPKTLADKLGFSSAVAVYKWKRGISLPSIDNLVDLSEVFGVTLDELLIIREGSKNGKAKSTGNNVSWDD